MPRVRPATAADAPAILPMVRAVCDLHERLDPRRYDTLADVLDRYARWLPQRAADPRSVLLVADAESSASIDGFLVATIEPNIPIYRRREFGFIHDLWVEPAARRRGVARALVHSCLDRFAALGVDQVRLETAALNEPAQRLFASLGFRAGTIGMLRDLSAGDQPPAGA